VKKLLYAAAAFGLPYFPTRAFAGLDETINNAVAPISNAVASTIFYSVPVAGTEFPLIVGWLVFAAIVFTVYFGFIQFRAFGHAIALVRGDYSDPADAGEVSHFQALATALSGTVGLGNIAGVAVAVSIGGAGATFWMILAGLLGMASKFTECTLGVKYRNELPDGTISGGPMYYLSKGLAEKGKAGLGRFLALFFSICCVGGALGGGNMFQANQAFQQVVNVTGGAASPLAGFGWLFGLVMAALVGFVIRLAGVELTSAAFGSAFGFFPYILALAVLLFAFSTMLSWSYYGLKAWTYLFGEGQLTEITFKLIFCVFVVLGASMSLGPVIDFSDSMIFAMALANIVGLYILMPVVKQEVEQYFAKLRSGEIRKIGAAA
jgi:alanine or glycine:cation symporter, AGCS family